MAYLSLLSVSQLIMSIQATINDIDGPTAADLFIFQIGKAHNSQPTVTINHTQLPKTKILLLI
jgi:hypothetical protein